MKEFHEVAVFAVIWFGLSSASCSQNVSTQMCEIEAFTRHNNVHVDKVEIEHNAIR